jgi:pyridoxal phosphate enzyme (YggS family)
VVAAIDEVAVQVRLSEIRARIAAAEPRGRVEVVAVTKGHPVDAWRAATRAGCEGIGENYAQELLGKWEEVGESVAPIHFVGAVQSNKVARLAPIVSVWHGLDRTSVIEAVARHCAAVAAGSVRAPRVFVQVNATGEESKSGCVPGDAARLVSLAREHGLHVAGLMTMGPSDGDPVRTRTAFTTVRVLADELGLVECSMGMSDDFEIAVACGSTMVRLGTALFGPRSASK